MQRREHNWKFIEPNALRTQYLRHFQEREVAQVGSPRQRNVRAGGYVLGAPCFVSKERESVDNELGGVGKGNLGGVDESSSERWFWIGVIETVA